MIRLEHVTKTFQTRDGDVHAVKDVSLDIAEGQIFGIIGFSGAGKSTLVRCMNLLERPEEGKVIFDGKNLLDLDAAGLRHARQKMSMIFQHFNLMRSRTVYENIALPLRMEKRPKEEIDKKVMELLDLIDLVERRDSYPSQLSGGQKQRVAIARALAAKPDIVFADEPTGNLDSRNGGEVMELLKSAQEETGTALVVITHDDGIAALAPGRFSIVDGILLRADREKEAER